MTPFPQVTSHLLTGRLNVSHCFHYGRGSIWSLLKYTFILDIDLPSLRTFLPKLSSNDLQNALLTVMIVHPALFLPRNSLHSKTSVAMSPCSGNSLVLHVSHNPEAAGFIVWFLFCFIK